MDISCAFATSMDTPDHIAEAERLGYVRAWCYDSPALYPDVWMVLALAAARTRRPRAEPAPSHGERSGDRHARAAGARAGRGRDRLGLHGANGARAATDGVARLRRLRAGAPRAPAGRGRRVGRRDAAHAAPAWVRRVTTGRRPDPHRCRRPEGARGGG